MIEQNGLSDYHKIKHYGLTYCDYLDVNAKIKRQKDFLENSFVVNNLTGVAVSLKNGVISATLTPDRYYGFIQNRVNSLVLYATSNSLAPIFMTITLPSEYHPMKENRKGELVPNPKYNGCTPKEAAKMLTKKFSKLRHDRSLKELSKNERVYFKVVEPHKDGTPHLHLLLFVPLECVQRVIKAFNTLYRSDRHEAKANDIQSITDNIENATAYIMKYINKVLPLSKKEVASEKERYLNCWYSANRITRFYSSRTLAPLKLYRLLHNRYSLFALTKLRNNGVINYYEQVDNKEIIEIFENDELIYIKNENIAFIDPLERHKVYEYEIKGQSESFEQWEKHLDFLDVNEVDYVARSEKSGRVSV